MRLVLPCRVLCGVKNNSVVEEAEAHAATGYNGKLDDQKRASETSYPTQLNQQTAESHELAIALAEERLQMVEDLRVRVNALDKVFTWNSDYQRASHQVRVCVRVSRGRYVFVVEHNLTHTRIPPCHPHHARRYRRHTRRSTVSQVH